MNIKKHCNCPSEKLTKQSFNDLIFEAIQMANKDQKDRMLIINNGTVSHIKRMSEADIQEMNIKVLAYVPINSKIKDVELLQDIS